MEAARILVTGCGRSGTAYTAALLSALDIDCGHEQVFSLHGVFGGEVVWPEGLVAESSWLAAPFLNQLPADTAVLHQVREPLEVVRSLTRVRLFEQASAYREFVEAHLVGIAGTAPLEACLRYWDGWNALVQRGARERGLHYQRVRLDQLTPERVSALLDGLGYYRAPGEVADRMALLRGDTNTRGDRSHDAQLTWEVLPACGAKRASAVRAAEYGFEPRG